MDGVTVRTEDGENARRVLSVDAWEFSIWADLPDGEPRIRDVTAAERLQFQRPRKIRDLIERTFPGEKRNNIHQRPTVGRTPGQVAAQTVTEYWLTEAQLLKVVARSSTPVADAILDDMIRVYILVRRGLLAPAPESTAVVPQPAKDTGSILPTLQVFGAAVRAVDRELTALQVAHAAWMKREPERSNAARPEWAGVDEIPLTVYVSPLARKTLQYVAAIQRMPEECIATRALFAWTYAARLTLPQF